MNMKSALPPGMLEATRLTQAGRLTEATAALQQMLGPGGAGQRQLEARSGPSTIDGVAEEAGRRDRRERSARVGAGSPDRPLASRRADEAPNEARWAAQLFRSGRPRPAPGARRRATSLAAPVARRRPGWRAIPGSDLQQAQRGTVPTSFTCQAATATGSRFPSLSCYMAAPSRPTISPLARA